MSLGIIIPTVNLIMYYVFWVIENNNRSAENRGKNGSKIIETLVTTG